MHTLCYNVVQFIGACLVLLCYVEFLQYGAKLLARKKISVTVTELHSVS